VFEADGTACVTPRQEAGRTGAELPRLGAPPHAVVATALSMCSLDESPSCALLLFVTTVRDLPGGWLWCVCPTHCRHCGRYGVNLRYNGSHAVTAMKQVG
jgi:hypothetical protein